MRILFAEDDEAVGRATAASLTAAGFVVDLVESRDDALHALKSHNYDAAVFDIMLMDGSGLDALAMARRSGLNLPVLLLTALGSVDDRVAGLNAGADDYLVKPFSVDELIARLRALQRRLGTSVAMALTVENASFDPTSRMMSVNGDHVALSRAESIVVERFMRSLGRVVTKEQLAESIYSFNEEYTGNAVEVHVHRVRRKLENSGAIASIKTVRGLGYIMVTDKTA
ncbi:MAG: response regulator transcription factor [Chelatococcus sp.]|jgi:DNA-binding response OmpR family regulator|uniref:response regulator transcription factor n=1 Tax=unclassified Chelatococcus TaxID=2638111 RepID=UPI001BCE882E|nr:MULTISPECIES: response regulator transcription factor [unclassified Chelatococcus]CAH1654393.1 Two component transcriptional regulator, winged helix family [Hyphomicrobiales bacterium]MBS7742789.1 response regulator transcription factor [Chelatococcus sp. HY11]MBX3538441.1 response regulator transcription factor [Chelatococcus sp.]MBX3542093.1 response regulator transcription factor [Chelatococcus sp.]MCO5075691.1 response regulator transcription factor [Chelatococcus sp.]